ncbi:hypothetical protein BASA50_000794 [Batrachochytrium salamandrivorans]|uniref:Conserved oligomeric Golgi complex subunit 1 n=1 Tax=Batrachochytrium salamandrivorans TaxID=1357716 RepID=A0ABQ8EVS9_9FUNG|nr:hypothetical protein BASA50_000794 [Batrachochytrium salamandrivorans]
MAEEDADGLFRRHSVGELKLMLGKIKQVHDLGALLMDAERKKHELRIMVGERYRDVIGAADAILLMREASKKMGDLFEATDSLCDVSALKKSSHSRAAGSDHSADDERKRLLFSVAAQIRLLVITPEQIWTTLEEHQYLAAARLYLISRLGFSGLQTGRQALLFKIPSSFPVVQRQWDAISPFKVQIIEKSTSRLRNISLNDQQISEILGAIAMLDNISPKETLKVFLAQRAISIEHVFSSKTTPASSDTICKQIIECIDIIHRTLVSIEKLFIASPTTLKGDQDLQVAGSSLIELFLKRLQKASSREDSTAKSLSQTPLAFHEDSLCLVSDLYSEKTNMHILFRHLPESIQRFFPVMNLDSNTVNLCNESVQSSTQQWLHTITRMIQTEGSSVLSSISSGVSLVAIRSRTLEYIHVIQTQTSFAFETSSALVPPPTSTGLHDTSWEKLVRRVLPMPSFSLWTDMYRQLFMDRSISLINTAFELITNQPQTLLREALTKLNKSPHADRDVASFVWNTGVSEIHERNISYSNIKAVCRMQTPSIKELGEEFESAVMLVRLDVLPLIEMQTAYSSYPLSGRDSSALSIGVSAKAGMDSLDMQKDTKALSLTFRDSFFTAIKAYRDGMLDQLNEISSRIREEEMTEHVFGIDHSLFIGRTARIISLKVGKLISDYESRPMYRQGLGSGGSGGSLPSAAQQFLNHRTSHLLSSKRMFPQQELLMEVYNQAHGIWISYVARRLEVTLRFQLENHDWKHGEQFQIVWESVAIQAQGETGNTMESKISLPVHVSSFVLNLLLDVCAELNRIGSYTLEKPCLKQLLLEISSRIIGVYSTFVNSDIHGKTISEKGAFQLLFDFLLLVKVMEGSWQQDTVVGGASSPTSTLKQSSLQSSHSGLENPEQKASAVTAAIKLKIDPIDLAIVEGQIVSNVERFYSRAWVILGSLLLLNPRPYGTKRSPSLQEHHNLISIAPTCSRFTLLPMAGAVHARTTVSKFRPSAATHDPMQGYIASSKSRSSSSLTDVSKTDGTPKDTSKPAMDTASAHALSKRRTRPKVILCLSKTTHGSSSNDRLPSLASAMDSQAGSSTGGGAGSSGGRVMGLVNAVAGNISLSSSQQQKATELLMNASSFISGVWGTSSPSANISVGSGGDSAGTLKRQVNK